MVDHEHFLAHGFQSIFNSLLEVFLHNDREVIDILDCVDSSMFVRLTKWIFDSCKIEALLQKTRNILPVVFCTRQSDEKIAWAMSHGHMVVDPCFDVLPL